MKKHEYIESNQSESETNEAQAIRYFGARMQSIQEALTDANKQDALLNDCLAVDARIVLSVELSTGGPGDGFKITCDTATGQPLHGYHYFVNWGFRRECSLSPDELNAVCAAYAIDDARLYLNRQ